MTDISGTVYVTGVAGMIGSNLARGLLELGYTVIGVDNFWRGTAKNIADFQGKNNFKFRHADICVDRDWYFDMDDKSIVIHTADIVAGIGYVFSNEWSVFQKNLLINTQVARIVNERRPQRLIYLGTACSYPQQLQRSVDMSVLREDLKFPADPESGYGWSKLMGDIEFRLATKGSATRLTVLDLHNVYGWPCIYRDQTSQVIPSLIYKAIKSTDGRLTVWGNGSQGRAFVHVSDVVAAVELALNYDGEHSTFMIGPDRCTRISEVANLIKEYPSLSIKQIVYDDLKPTGDVGRFADANRARKEIGWIPKVEFRDGLYDLIEKMVYDCK